MKKIFTLIAFIATITTLAQAPQGFNYQATVRNAAGALIVNQNVNFKFNLMQNSPTSVPVYSETHYVPTDDLGAVSLVIGQGTATTGIFNSINWGNGNYYLGIELNTGSGYITMGTTQLLSVPYALYAGSSQNKGKTSIHISGNISNAEAAAKIAAECGSFTENIIIENTTELSTIDLSMVTSLYYLKISNNTNLVAINFSGLTEVFENIYIKNNNSLGSLSFPSLTSVFGIYESFEIVTNPALTSISFPVLSNLESRTDIYGNDALTTLSFPALVSVNNLKVRGTPLTSINFPALTTIKDQVGINDNTKLTSIGLPALLNSNSLDLAGNAFSSSQINTILNKMLSIAPATGKYIYLNTQIPSAPPTGQGIIDKQTLIDTGNVVYTD